MNNYLFSGHNKYNLEIHKSKYSVNILENKDYSDYISVLINNTPYACVIKELDNKQICVNMQNYVFTFNVGNVSTINLTNNATDKNSELVPYYKRIYGIDEKLSKDAEKTYKNLKNGNQIKS